MAYLDPMATNQALKKLGSDYQMPDAAAPAPAVAAPAPAPTVTVNSVAPTPAPTPAADSTSGINKTAETAGTVADIVAPPAQAEGNDTKKKVIAGIKGAVNLYMGNYAGAAKAASELAG